MKRLVIVPLACLTLAGCSQTVVGAAKMAPDTPAETDFLTRLPVRVLPDRSNMQLKMAAIDTARKVCKKLDEGVDKSDMGPIFVRQYGFLDGATFLALALKDFCPKYL